MGYGKITKQLVEFANKSSHFDVIDEFTSFLQDYIVLNKQNNIEAYTFPFEAVPYNIERIIAIDSGETVVELNDYPSAKLYVVKFGIVELALKDILELSKVYPICPQHLSSITKTITTSCFIPSSNIKHKNHRSISKSIRYAMYKYYLDTGLASTLKYILYKEYESPSMPKTLSTHPTMPDKHNILINASDFDEHYKTIIEGEEVYITDMFRLHEIITEELGFSVEALHQFTLVTEHLMMLSLIRDMYETDKDLLSKTLFILDRPLSFYGQVSNLQQQVRDYFNFLHSQGVSFYLVGVEKSGAFVEHARLLKKKGLLPPSSFMLLDSDYIQSYIVPRSNQKGLYGAATYYGAKLFFHTASGKLYVCSFPTSSADVLQAPQPSDYPHLHEILSVLELLESNAYQDALLPIILANDTVAISQNPGNISLQYHASKILNK